MVAIIIAFVLSSLLSDRIRTLLVSFSLQPSFAGSSSAILESPEGQGKRKLKGWDDGISTTIPFLKSNDGIGRWRPGCPGHSMAPPSSATSVISACCRPSVAAEFASRCISPGASFCGSWASSTGRTDGVASQRLAEVKMLVGLRVRDAL